MNFVSSLKNLSSKVDASYKKYKEEAPQRDAARLESLRTKAAREKERARIQRERLEAKREVTQAKTALKKAENELRSNKGGSFDLNSMLFGTKKKASRPATRRRTVAKPTTKRKATSKKRKG